MLENFVSSPVWINMIKWDARKLRFLARLDKYDQMGCSKTSFPRSFGLFGDKLIFSFKSKYTFN